MKSLNVLAMFALAILLFGTILVVTPSEACTRAVYLGKDNLIVTGRSMDWAEDMFTNLWVFPRGMNRHGGLGPDKSLVWTSKYGSVIASAYEGGTTDGMNERGLVANLLYLAESEYSAEDDPRPALVISSWGQYMLDNFATVAEAVADARREQYRMVTVASPNGHKGTVHLSLSDATGDSAIFEYIGGKLQIHHSRDHQVMTNSPVFDQQLALNRYWEEIGGLIMLPGTTRAADRFVRASFYINKLPITDNAHEAVAGVFAVIRNVSVPPGIARPDQPNISSTLWRTVADQKNLVYYFENTASPSLLWVNLKELDLAPQSGVRKLDMVRNRFLGGDQTKNLVQAEPFAFLSPEH
ncbi:MAG TPA: linear amide C-N hydrolase [Phycisphaerales bacterium]|nr:linear amide C-N hydrolase [Phycisphaerales bacterium]HRQ75884.1 linear amide C-N hydrolase [Phycisphaerales bacterium]